MLEKLALKRLTASDLTFFNWHYKHLSVGNQKAINLNADVFIHALYPLLPIIAEKKGGRIPVYLHLYGPGLRGLHNLQRKIVKGTAYKNWRLDGEVINNPENDLERFNSLEPGDFVLFDFEGDLEPVSAKAVFVAKSVEVDSPLHSVLQAFLGSNSMVTLRSHELEGLLGDIDLPDEHPVHSITLETYLEDAALGGIEGIEKLRSGPFRGTVSPDALDRALENAKRIGRAGEEHVNSHFEEQRRNGLIDSFEWVSAQNAIAPYDFHLTESGGEQVFVEVKSTTSHFASRFHISFNELLAMGSESERHDLYRVYEMGDEAAQLRIAQDLGHFARSINQVLRDLPNGVRPKGVSVSPAVLPFGEAATIRVFDESEGDDA